MTVITRVRNATGNMCPFQTLYVGYELSQLFYIELFPSYENRFYAETKLRYCNVWKMR